MKMGEMNGRIEDGRIILESFYGDRFYFEKAGSRAQAANCVSQTCMGHGT